MNSKTLSVIIILSAAFFSCSSSKSVTTSKSETDQKTVPPPAQTFTYTLRLVASGSLNTPHDEIFLDTSGQITFNTDQRLKKGGWKRPRGLAFIEPRDEDTLLHFIQQEELFSIQESDITPQCPEGDQYLLKIHRSDLKNDLTVNTNTCASEFNLLSGSKRKLFSSFLTYIGRLRDRYRPGFTD
jgi:hypothetical protein